MLYRKLLNKVWKDIENHFEIKLGCCRGKLIYYGDRLLLINDVLTSLPMFMLSIFEIPNPVRKRLDFYRSRFFCQSDENKSKYHLTRRGVIVRPKDQGCLGVEGLKIKTKCLLSKWLFKLLREDGFGRSCLEISISTQKPCPRFKPNPLIHLFGKL